MFLKLFWICDLVDLSCFKKLSFLSFVRSFLNLEYSLVCSHFMKSLVFYLLTRVDGQLVIHSATSCPVHLVGSPPVSVFTLDYKGGVCCMSPSSPAGRTNWAPPPPGSDCVILGSRLLSLSQLVWFGRKDELTRPGNMAVTGCTKCIKYMLFFFNFIFWVSRPYFCSPTLVLNLFE